MRAFSRNPTRTLIARHISLRHGPSGRAAVMRERAQPCAIATFVGVLGGGAAGTGIRTSRIPSL